MRRSGDRLPRLVWRGIELLALLIALIVGALIAGVGSWRLRTLAPTAVSYLLHAVAAVAIYAALGPLAVPDADHYHKQALALVNGTTERPVTPGKELFTYLLRFVYSTIGVQPGIVIALNVLLVAALPTVLGWTASALRMPVRLTMWAGVLLPQTYLWGVLLLRESMIWFSLLAAVLALAKLYRRERWQVWVPVLVAALVLFTYTRGTLAIICAVAALLVLLLVVRSWRITVGTLVSMVVLAFILPGLGTIVTKIGNDSESAAERLPTDGNDAVTGFSFLDPAHMSSTIFHAPHFDNGFINLIVTKAIGLLNVSLGPLPWDLGRVGLVYFADGIIWVVILALAVVGWVTLKDKRSALVLVIPAAFILLAMGWTLFEYGTVIRLRLMPALVLLPLASMGAAEVWGRVRRRTTAPELASDPAK